MLKTMTADDTALTEEAEFDPQKYQPRNAVDAEKLRLLGVKVVPRKAAASPVWTRWRQGLKALIGLEGAHVF